MRPPVGRLLAASGCGMILLVACIAWFYRPPRADDLGARMSDTILNPSARAAGIAGVERLRVARLLANTGALSAEFERLRALPDDAERLRRSADLENEFADRLDPKTAALLIQRMPEGFVDTRFGTIALAKWASAERLSAAAWMAEHPGRSAAAGEALARGWFAGDRAALQSHLDELPPGPWKTQLAITAGEDAFLAHEPAAVLGLLNHAESTDARRLQLAEWNATAWAIRDVEAAAAWAEGEPQAERREKLLAAVAIGQANMDPAEASARLLRSVTDPEVLKPAIEALLRIWVARDPEAAAGWAANLPEGSIRREAETFLSPVAAP